MEPSTLSCSRKESEDNFHSNFEFQREESGAQFLSLDGTRQHDHPAQTLVERLHKFKNSIFQFYLASIILFSRDYYDPNFFLSFPDTGWSKNNESYSWV